MNLVLKHVGTVTPDVFIPYKENVNTNDLDAKKFKTQGYLNEKPHNTLGFTQSDDHLVAQFMLNR